jgi:hypothetical protein
VPNSDQERDAEGAEIRGAHRDFKAVIAGEHNDHGNLRLAEVIGIEIATSACGLLAMTGFSLW